MYLGWDERFGPWSGLELNASRAMAAALGIPKWGPAGSLSDYLARGAHLDSLRESGRITIGLNLELYGNETATSCWDQFNPSELHEPRGQEVVYSTAARVMDGLSDVCILLSRPMMV